MPSIEDFLQIYQKVPRIRSIRVILYVYQNLRLPCTIMACRFLSWKNLWVSSGGFASRLHRGTSDQDDQVRRLSRQYCTISDFLPFCSSSSSSSSSSIGEVRHITLAGTLSPCLPWWTSVSGWSTPSSFRRGSIYYLTPWLLDTFELQKSRASLAEERFYGPIVWVAIQRITLPICIFFRCTLQLQLNLLPVFAKW